MLTVSERAVHFIAANENKEPVLVARECPGDAWELSFGITFHPNGERVKEGDTITYEEHLVMFAYALRVFERAVHQRVTVELNQYQFDALVSLAWNIGVSAFAGSTVLRHVNDRRWEDAAEAFGDWAFATTRWERKSVRVKAPDGTNAKWTKAMRGLIRRHYAEALMFLGLQFEFIREDVDLVEMKVKRKAQWQPARNRYLDTIQYQTPFKEIKVLSPGRLDPAFYTGERPPIEPDPKKVSDKPVKSAKPKKPKKKTAVGTMVQSRTLWGASVLGVLATPEFQRIAEDMAGQSGGIVERVMMMLGVGLVVVGRVGAAGPIPIGRDK